MGNRTVDVTGSTLGFYFRGLDSSVGVAGQYPAMGRALLGGDQP